MKRKTLFPALIGALLLATTFWVGNVYATTGCFTDTNGLGIGFKNAICWMKANGLASGATFKPNNATTRAQSALWLQKASQIPPTTGKILISAGFGDWRPFSSTENISFSYFSSETQASKATAGSNFLSIHPSIPTVLYGRSLQFLGVEFCYAASTSVALSYVEINTYTHTAGAGSRNLRFSDATARTDSACRYYVLPTPVTLTAEDGANFFIQGNWTVANTSLSLGRTTFVFKATGTKALDPTSLSGENVIILQEGGPQPDGGSTDGK